MRTEIEREKRVGKEKKKIDQKEELHLIYLPGGDALLERVCIITKFDVSTVLFSP